MTQFFFGGEEQEFEWGSEAGAGERTTFSNFLHIRDLKRLGEFKFFYVAGFSKKEERRRKGGELKS